MNCDQRELHIQAYIDGELALTETLDLESHLSTCQTCTAFLEASRAVSRLSSDPALRFEVPLGLEKRVKDVVRRGDQGGQTLRERPLPIPWPSAVGFAFAACLAAFLAFQFIYLPSKSANDSLTQEVVSSHVRSLMAAHLLDVVSTDQHTVKPWFAGKLDFSPPVNDFASKGFPLIGGRLDYINGHPAAAMVYRHAKHVINLFAWPEAGAKSRTVANARGYNTVTWDTNGMELWAVSDLNSKELTQFTQLVDSPPLAPTSQPQPEITKS